MSPPLTPDRDEARRQLADELSNPIYADVQDWLADQVRKFLDWLTGANDSAHALSTGQLVVIVATAVALLALAAWTLLGPVRSARRVRAAAVFTDTERTAADLHADAAALAAAGEWAAATLAAFRALVRGLVERGVVEEFAGMTAHEAAGRAAVRLPRFADRLGDAADAFDSLAYGRRAGSSDGYERTTALDAELADARPEPLVAHDEPAPVGIEAGR